MPDASPINAGSLFVLAAIAVAGLAAFVAQNFEPNPNARAVAGPRADASPEAVFADRTYYVVRWRSRRDTVYEGLNSVAERAEAGTDVSVRCTSLLEANAQIRRLAKADAGVVAKIYKVTGASVVELEPGGGTTPDAEDEWVGDFTDVVKNAPVGRSPARRRSAPTTTGKRSGTICCKTRPRPRPRRHSRCRRAVVEVPSLRVTKGEIDAVRHRRRRRPGAVSPVQRQGLPRHVRRQGREGGAVRAVRRARARRRTVKCNFVRLFYATGVLFTNISRM